MGIGKEGNKEVVEGVVKEKKIEGDDNGGDEEEEAAEGPAGEKKGVAAGGVDLGFDEGPKVKAFRRETEEIDCSFQESGEGRSERLGLGSEKGQEGENENGDQEEGEEKDGGYGQEAVDLFPDQKLDGGGKGGGKSVGDEEGEES